MAAASPLQALSGLFPLTQPVPTPLTHPHLVPLSELGLELDLIRSGSANFSRWVHHIANVTAGVNASEKAARGTASEQELALLGAKLATKNGREGLQRLTDIYERALAQFPGSYKLWKGYLDMRCSYVLGTPKRKLNLRAPKKKRVEAANDDGQGNETSYLFLKYLKEGRKDPETGEVGEELSDAEVDVDAQWEGGLDGVVGAPEWRALAGTFERALMWLPRVSADHITLCDVLDLWLANTQPGWCRLSVRRCLESGSTTSTSSCIPAALLSCCTPTLAAPSTEHCASWQSRSTSVSGACT